MVWVAILKSTGQSVAQGGTLSEAYNAAIAQGYSPDMFTVIMIGGGPRV